MAPARPAGPPPTNTMSISTASASGGSVRMSRSMGSSGWWRAGTMRPFEGAGVMEAPEDSLRGEARGQPLPDHVDLRRADLVAHGELVPLRLRPSLGVGGEGGARPHDADHGIVGAVAEEERRLPVRLRRLLLARPRHHLVPAQDHDAAQGLRMARPREE